MTKLLKNLCFVLLMCETISCGKNSAMNPELSSPSNADRPSKEMTSKHSNLDQGAAKQLFALPGLKNFSLVLLNGDKKISLVGADAHLSWSCQNQNFDNNKNQACFQLEFAIPDLFSFSQLDFSVLEKNEKTNLLLNISETWHWPVLDKVNFAQTILYHPINGKQLGSSKIATALLNTNKDFVVSFENIDTKEILNSLQKTGTFKLKISWEENASAHGISGVILSNYNNGTKEHLTFNIDDKLFQNIFGNIKNGKEFCLFEKCADVLPISPLTYSIKDNYRPHWFIDELRGKKIVLFATINELVTLLGNTQINYQTIEEMGTVYKLPVNKVLSKKIYVKGNRQKFLFSERKNQSVPVSWTIRKCTMDRPERPDRNRDKFMDCDDIQQSGQLVYDTLDLMGTEYQELSSTEFPTMMGIYENNQAWDDRMCDTITSYSFERHNIFSWECIGANFNNSQIELRFNPKSEEHQFGLLRILRKDGDGKNNWKIEGETPVVKSFKARVPHTLFVLSKILTYEF